MDLNFPLEGGVSETYESPPEPIFKSAYYIPKLKFIDSKLDC